MADPNNPPQPPARTPSKPSSSQIPVRTTPGIPFVPRAAYTPGPGARTPRGLLISAHNTPNPNATPHVRAAYRAIDSRRAAILTPHHARRRSLREARETPRNFLLQLGKVLAPKSERIPSSSSSPGSALSGAAGGGGQEEGDTSEELTFDISTRSRYGDDDEEELPKRPRLSLPIGGGGGLGDMEEGDWEDDMDDDLPQPHRSAGLEDLTENFTVQSIELPRRMDPEKDQHRIRDSMGRLSDFPQPHGQQQQQSDGIDSGFFPPAAIEDDEFGNAEDRIPDEFSRLDSDETRRRETIGGEGGLGLLGAGGRDSDFHIEVPVGMDESTFMIASPTRQFEMGQAAEAAATSGQGGGFAELMDRRSDSYDDNDDDGNDIGPTFDDYDNDDGMGMDLDNNHDQDQAAGSDEEMTKLSGYTPTAARVSLSASAAREKLGFFREEGGERGGFSKIKATKKISKHGIEYTSLSPAMVKRLAQTFAKTSGAKGNISPEALKAIMQASDWFFEQLGDDLSAYAKHAHRKTIDMSDMLTLMKRYV
ncbi:centromere kinetochore component CENP-T-domain-containing protein [Neurospora tetraspora]|uniref:Centromere kinetochore component CENP-T-domain-containing protein n=1 Tax=Neurospora tetraspora TaxID=94610 RepID=A0AAE0JNV7_9PEZI|nr:centromere kinetochore component CENP-T-domain-containing protein [Neurospora tetraspora]